MGGARTGADDAAGAPAAERAARPRAQLRRLPSEAAVARTHKYGYADGAVLLPTTIYWDKACSVCMGEFLQHPQTVHSVHSQVVDPGFLSCGHLMCEECFVALNAREELTDRLGHVRCPQCRTFTSHRWQCLLDKTSDNERTWKATPAPGTARGETSAEGPMSA